MEILVPETDLDLHAVAVARRSPSGTCVVIHDPRSTRGSRRGGRL